MEPYFFSGSDCTTLYTNEHCFICSFRRVIEFKEKKPNICITIISAHLKCIVL